MSSLYKVALLALSSILFVNCGGNDGQSGELPGEVVTSSFLKDFSGSFVEQDGDESVVFSEGGSIVVNSVRQVGSEDSESVPYPTVCTYSQRGQVTAIYELSEKYRTRTNSENSETYLNPETHRIDYIVSNIVWNREADENNPDSANCENFEKETNASPESYSLGTEVLSDDQLRFHTSGGGDYVGQAEGTPSILDEVFNRQ